MPKPVYDFLHVNTGGFDVVNIKSIDVKEYIEMLLDTGFLSSHRVKISEHPETKYLNSHMNSNMTSLIIQVTQNCNLRCDYCVYSGSYYNRVHNNKRMSFEIAKRGIDYLANHSSDVENLHIGFYGGEPLLEFDLIKKCIEYANYRCEGKDMYYNMTTNGILITKEMVEYFEKCGLLIMFSLDGPKYMHDSSRRTGDDRGSFDILFNNVRMIKENFPAYFKKQVNFNTVINMERSYNCVSEYISGEELLRDSIFQSSFISEHNAKKKKKVSSQFIEELRYEYFKILLAKIGEFPESGISTLAKSKYAELDEFRFEKNRIGRVQLPEKYHHGGPCIPGSFKLFMNVDGDFFPCERVNENSIKMKIGDVNNGIDIAKVSNLLNIEKLTEEDCRNCWAYNYCHICASSINESYTNVANSILEECNTIKAETEERLKDYCVLKMFDYQY